MKDIVGKATWLITALASVNLGLEPLGYSIFMSEFWQANLHQFQVPVHYLIGLAGLMSLVYFFTGNKGD